MDRFTFWPALVAAVAGLIAVPAFGLEPMKISDLPSAVRATLAKNFGTAKVASAERDDNRNDAVYFTVLLRDGKTEQKVTITETGEVVEPPR